QVSSAQHPFRHLSLCLALSFLGLMVPLPASTAEALAGRIVRWGTVGPFPDGLLTAMSVNGLNCVGIKADGSVVEWYSSSGVATPPPIPLTDIMAVAVGKTHKLALRANGTVAAWGGGEHGALDVPANLSGVTAIAAGWNFNLALKAD